MHTWNRGHTLRVEGSDAPYWAVVKLESRVSALRRVVEHRRWYYWDFPVTHVGASMHSEEHRDWLRGLLNRLDMLESKFKERAKAARPPEVSVPSHWCEGFGSCETCNEAEAELQALLRAETSHVR